MSLFQRVESGDQKQQQQQQVQQQQPQQQQQDDKDKVWFNEFDKETLNIENFLKINKDTQLKRYDSTFILINFVQNFLSTLSEIKKGKINDFKIQKAELEKNKIRIGISYYYEAMVIHILENLDFYLRNEINMFKIKQHFRKDEQEREEYHRKISHMKNQDHQSNYSSPRKGFGVSQNSQPSAQQQQHQTYEIDILFNVIRQEEAFLKKCQDYIAIEKLYCLDFWSFQSEKQRYYRYFCTCVRLFFFFYELAAFKDLKHKYHQELYRVIQPSESDLLNFQQNKEDTENLFLYSYNESKYCLQHISKNFDVNDSNSLGLNLLTLLLKSLIKEEFDQTKAFILQKLDIHRQPLIDEFKDVIEQSYSKANDIINNQFKELELVKIVKQRENDYVYPIIMLKKEELLQQQRQSNEEEDLANSILNNNVDDNASNYNIKSTSNIVQPNIKINIS